MFRCLKLRVWRHPGRVLSSLVYIGILVYIAGVIKWYRQPYKNKAMVLVVAYMRSGSSLVGEILQTHYSSFYVFEPLRSVTEYTEALKPVVFFNGTVREISSKSELSQVHADILYNWFTCNLTMLDLGSLTSDFHMYYSIRSQPYYRCLTQNGKSRDAVAKCLHLLEEICIPTELRAIKTIRIDMSTVSILMKKLPTLKVVHLFRDPRAILHSQVRVKLSVWDDIGSQARLCCSKMLLDIQTSKALALKHKDRLKILIYERLAESPIENAKNTYKWANITMHKFTENHIHYLTNTSRLFRCEWCARRSNSLATSRQWRRSLRGEHMKVINEYCLEVYRELGYTVFYNQEELRNLTIPSVKTVQFTKNAL